jgi:uncharacterized membrane protein YhaH (DUF805 family)
MKKYYLDILTNKYADFNGRARRKEYWMWTLYYTIVLLFAMVLDNVLGLNFELFGQDLGYGWLYVTVAITHLIPGLGIVIRRLHDVGKSGWFYLIILIPLIGFIWVLVLFCTDGVQEDNKWGSNPKLIN